MKTLAPYRKAIVAGLVAGVTVAATYYQVPWLQIASAVVAPFAVYAVPNEATE